MANWQAQRLGEIRGVDIAAVCDIDEVRAREFGARHAPAAGVFTDFARLLREASVDAVSIVAPDAVHCPLSLQALNAGKHVLCEKPLATNHADARRMAAAARKARVVNMVNFSYRNAPAIQKAARLVAAGRLGEIVHVEARYLQSWLPSQVWGDWKTSPGWLWRLSTRHGSAGVLGDIGVHILDFATFPVGPIRSVQARLKTFAKLKGNRVGKYKLDANDTALLHVEFANGALGVIHTTRWATGHANSLALAIYGTKGALRVDLDRSQDELEVCLGRDIDQAKWTTLKAPPVPTIYQRFITAIRTGKAGDPDFARGAEIQKVLDACFKSDRTGRAVPA
jgi:predicted dehydrogenase